MTISDSGGVSSLAQSPIRAPIVRKPDGKLEAPKNILQSVYGAKAIFYQNRLEHLKRIEMYALIEGLVAGNPPYDPVELERHKLGYLSNFNNLDPRSLYERAATAYWNLINETENLVTFSFPGNPNSEYYRFAEIMSRHWSNVIRSWPSFTTVYNTLCGQLVKFGLSPVVWPNEKDWRFRTVELSRFFVEDQAQADIEMLTSIQVETVYTAQFLMAVYNEFEHLIPEGMKADGKWDYDVCPWNLNELSKYLLYKANVAQKQNQNFYDMMDVQRVIQNGDVSWNQIFTDDLRLVSHFNTEYDKRVSHYMYDAYVDYGEFLFFQNRQYHCMSDGIVIFTASPGDFTLHSNRGTGHKIFSMSQAIMQLDCTLLDLAKYAGTPLFNSQSQGTKDFEPIRLYPGVPTHIGTAEMVNNQIGVNAAPVMQISQYLMQKVLFNTVNSGDDPSTPDRAKGSMSAFQARLESFREFAISKNQIVHFYNFMDTVVRNMTAKMMRSRDGDPGYEYAERWINLCLADGVPKQLLTLKEKPKGVAPADEYFELPAGLQISASRAAGNGSTAGKIIGLETLAPFIGGFPSEGQFQFKKELVTSTLGAEAVPAYLGSSQMPEENSQGASLAGVENGLFITGISSPIVSPDNDQKAHFITHMAAANEVINQRKQQQMDAVSADKVFVGLIPHMQQHFQIMASDPMIMGPFLEQIKRPWNELLDYAKLNRKNAEAEIQAQIRKQQEDQQKTNQVLNDEQRKNMQAQGDEARANFKVERSEARAQQQSEDRARIMQEDVQAKNANKKLQITLENDNKTITDHEADVAATPLPELRQQLENMSGGIASTESLS